MRRRDPTGSPVVMNVAKIKKGLRRGRVTLSIFRSVNFSDRDDGRDGREWRIPLFWRPVVLG